MADVMPTLEPLVLALVLGAAVMHASWNALLKAGGDKLVMQGLVMAAPSLVAGPALFFLPPMAAAAWPFLAVSVAIHLLYNGLLVGAYTHGDLSQVYPIARGSAPALVALGGWAFAGELASPAALVGIALVSFGIVSLAWRRGLPRDGETRAIAFAVATGASIAAYSLADGLGGRAAGEVFTYIAWLLFLEGPLTLGFVVWRRRGRLRAAFAPYWLKGLFGGLIAGLAYGIVIWAMSRAPMAQVVALRETSVLLATGIGALLLHEPFGRHRIAAAGVIVVGAVVLELGS